MQESIQSKNLVILAGNPNVGKSSVFNNLTGLKQHTGNWVGKTVDGATGYFKYNNEKFTLIDTPGTYSLFARSKDEEVSKNLICFGDAKAVVIVCDATSLERNLNLVLQITEVIKNVVLCINLADEAKSKGIKINIQKLKNILGIPIVLTSARSGEGLEDLKKEIYFTCKNYNYTYRNLVKYDEKVENIIKNIYEDVKDHVNKDISIRWICLQLIQGNETTIKSLEEYLKKEISVDIKNKIKEATSSINFNISDEITSKIIYKAEKVARDVITYEKDMYNQRDLKIDKVITSKITGIPIMLLLLTLIFWITIVVSSYPSNFLTSIFLSLKVSISHIFKYLKIPYAIESFLLDGIYHVLAWVVSVMLPSMAIFFPLFTILEDLGYLSRVAFNLDKAFKNSNTCGKQALTMAMGFGCNCVGVTSCRIIDSDRERLIAILTNSFVPCNGRFPILISIISMFLVGTTGMFFESIYSATLLTFVIFLSIFMTLLMSKILSKTILKGLPSNFTIELPPYRKPQILKVIFNTIFDRTLVVLGRAILAAIPAGIIIWIMTNITVNGVSILNYCTIFLDPIAKLIGLDGVILMAFILGFPANEIVIPAMIMIYINSNTLIEYESISQLKTLLIDNGWTLNTAICTIIFTLFHFPCATTCITIKKETKSYKWTFLSFILPTLIGIFICSLITIIFKIFNY